LGWKEQCVFEDEINLIVDYYKDRFVW
jgi:hypothetical protein